MTGKENEPLINQIFITISILTKMKKSTFLPKLFKNAIGISLLMLFAFSVIGQNATGYQYPDYKGNKFPFNPSGLTNAEGPFVDDDMISIRVQPGYVAEVFEHYDGKGSSVKVTGKIPDLTRIYPYANQGNWKDRISSVKINKLPAGYEKSDAIVSGIYRLRNPYVNFYLRSGYDNTGEQVSIDFTQHQKPDSHDQEYQFVVIRQRNGQYLIFSAATGYALLPTAVGSNDSNQEAGIKGIGSQSFGGQKEATFALKGLGLGRYVICTYDNQQMAITAHRHNNNPRLGLKVQRLQNEAEQQFEFELVKRLDGVPLPPELNKDEPIPTQYSLLNFVNGETSPHKKKSVNIPFYMVQDPHIPDMKDRMNRNPYYVLEREDFIKRIGGSSDGWKLNHGGTQIEFGATRASSSSSGTNRQVDARVGFSSTTSVEADALFVTVSQSFTISAELGYAHSWNESSSSSSGTHELYKVSPCSKGTVYAVTSRIKLKRKNGDVVKTFEVYRPGSFSYKEIPLNPETCPTLRSMGEKKYNDALQAYNNYVNKHNNGEGAIATNDTPELVERGVSQDNLNEEDDKEGDNWEEGDEEGGMDNDEDNWSARQEVRAGGGSANYCMIESNFYEGYAISKTNVGAGLVENEGQADAYSTFKVHGSQDVSFELVEFPGQFLKVDESGGVIFGSDDAGNPSASFTKKEGEEGVILFESVAYPGYYLVVGQEGLSLAEEEDSDTFYNVASFMISPVEF